ncbi:helix-turn-helix domain-containing protein [Myceligenerans indicum]|uniref:Helix-turn-helix transcriptional regulator n=1 Tax=Myceligenerans indicum TaxID=2593663 RepID=A0ABS1LLP9_9MICO|nr:helix-turn-helix transcriptional regulator [Myceligenerans indicum]MBL0887185.1 helix-turn-helix transcriptional regulator [Myceligenerans indicum]
MVELPTVPTHVWDDAGVRSALDDWDFGQVSRMVRQLVPLRQEDVAALTGLSQSYLSMLECGDRKLTDVARVVQFLSGLGTPVDLVRLPLPGSSRGDGAVSDRSAAALAPAGGTRPATGSVRTVVRKKSDVARTGAANATADDEVGPSLTDPMLDPVEPWTNDRLTLALRAALRSDVSVEEPRSALQFAEPNAGNSAMLSGLTLAAYVHHWGTEETELLRRTVGGARVTQQMCDHLQGTTDQLRMMDAGAGSGSVADMARAHLALVLRALEHGNFDESVGRRLAGVAADTAAQAGWYAFDADRHSAAQAYLLGSLRAAHTAQDARLGAGALSYLAIHAYANDRPRDAIVAAQAGRQQVRGFDVPHLEAVLLTRQARGHALLGEREAVRRALGTAAELCVKGPGKDDPHWIYWMNEGEIHGQTASASLAMGDTAAAVQSFGRAAEGLNPTEQRTRGLFLARAAQAYARAGDLDAACATGGEVVTLAERVQSARLRKHLTDVASDVRAAARRTTRGRSHAGARNLTERIAMLA